MSVRLKLFQVDAFTDRPFHGNPAAVVPLAQWLPDATLQAIAAENNLSETAYFVQQGERYHLRWFTPVCEVNLCGHATLASAWVLWEKLGERASLIRFDTRGGELRVTRADGLLWLDFPADPPRPCAAPPVLVSGLGVPPREVLLAGNYVALYDDEAAVRALTPDFRQLATLDNHGVIVTAPGKDCDFVSRFFAPRFGIDEDPVTGSAHCTLAPLWAGRLGKTALRARQISHRGGELRCETAGERVRIGGQASAYLEGEIELL
jgi:predicted PhzF superfamily epimerase YddE/YHI9